MNDEKPLTRTELIAALEEAGVATKDDVEKAVFKTVSQATDDILLGMEGIMEVLRTEIKASSDALESRLKRTEIELHALRDSIDGLKADLSDKAPRKQLNELESRVSKYHPFS